LSIRSTFIVQNHDIVNPNIAQLWLLKQSGFLKAWLIYMNDPLKS